MVKADDIIERLDKHAKAVGLAVPKKAKDALRKNRDNGNLPSLTTLLSIAQATGCSVGYLIGETVDPSQPPAPPTSLEAGPYRVVRFQVDPAREMVALEFEAEEGSVFQLLTESKDALSIAADMEAAGKRARQYSMDNPPVAIADSP